MQKKFWKRKRLNMQSAMWHCVCSAVLQQLNFHVQQA